jgi:hypothetical protein
MKRTIKVLLVTALIAVILVVSISPAMARRGNFGHRMPTDKSCESTNSAQNEGGAHHKVDPDGHTGCWVVVPGLNE